MAAAILDTDRVSIRVLISPRRESDPNPILDNKSHNSNGSNSNTSEENNNKINISIPPLVIKDTFNDIVEVKSPRKTKKDLEIDEGLKLFSMEINSPREIGERIAELNYPKKI